MPDRNLVTLCGMLKCPVVLLGGKEDAELGEFIRHRVGETVFNACGKTGLNASAALVKHADSIITHDTGLMHIAAAFGKRIVSVWGNTIPEFGMYPYKNREAPNRFSSKRSRTSLAVPAPRSDTASVQRDISGVCGIRISLQSRSTPSGATPEPC